MFYACAKQEDQTVQPKSEEIAFHENHPGILAFNSHDDLGRMVSLLKETDSFELPMTRAVSKNFTSLRDELIIQGLREFTETELATIESEGLIYEPEDVLIADPHFMAVLNKDREIQVGQEMYRYTNDGVIEYDASYAGRFDELALEKPDVSRLVPGERMVLSDKASFIKIADNPFENIENPINGATPQVTYDDDGSLLLSNRVKIPKENIREVLYGQGAGDGSDFQK